MDTFRSRSQNIRRKIGSAAMAAGLLFAGHEIPAIVSNGDSKGNMVQVVEKMPGYTIYSSPNGGAYSVSDPKPSVSKYANTESDSVAHVRNMREMNAMLRRQQMNAMLRRQQTIMNKLVELERREASNNGYRSVPVVPVTEQVHTNNNMQGAWHSFGQEQEQPSTRPVASIAYAQADPPAQSVQVSTANSVPTIEVEQAPRAKAKKPKIEVEQKTNKKKKGPSILGRIAEQAAPIGLALGTAFLVNTLNCHFSGYSYNTTYNNNSSFGNDSGRYTTTVRGCP